MLDKRLVINWGSINCLRSGALVVLLSLLGACASPSVVVKGSVPSPLIDKLPLTASLNYTEEFTQYSYQESEKKRALKSLGFGVAQVDMFDKVFTSILNLVPPENPIKDLIIEPEILDFQYTAPRETKLKLYEVWLKYRLRITDSNNKEVADWVVKGYGKTPTALLTSASAAFNAAANVALRDVGAQLSIGFRSQPDIAALLQKTKSRIDPQTEPAEEAVTDIDQEDFDEN